VKAVDGTSSESDWAIPGSFYVGEGLPAPTPGWMRYLWIGIGGAVAAVITIRVRRSRAE